ncbi:hypothetical protein KP509_04G019900 [Ceratopteris richardii]|uniref:Uncharacterized protein n=2 Tax=Ceratopteris richardii TaxID=49495 RepID=A0A8T2UV30_CERRI|nr:hypothetical protein KP509_04G019900 [Ceratopteris richardii]
MTWRLRSRVPCDQRRITHTIGLKTRSSEKRGVAEDQPSKAATTHVKVRKEEAPKANSGRLCSKMMLVKDYACPWWSPDPSTGIWSPGYSSPPHSSINYLNTRLWIRSEEAF